MTTNAIFVNMLEELADKVITTNRGTGYDVSEFTADCYEFIYNLEKNENYRRNILTFISSLDLTEDSFVNVQISKKNYLGQFDSYQQMSWDNLCLDFDFTYFVKDAKEEVKTIAYCLEKFTYEDQLTVYEKVNYINLQKYSIIIDCLRDIKNMTNGVPIIYTIDGGTTVMSALPIPQKYNTPTRKTPVVKEVLEKDLENELVEWLHLNGICAEKQTSVGKYRTDIWIPGVCFLELKRGKVTSKDFCQAFRYSVETDRKIVIVGKDVEKDVITTINLYNNIQGCEKIVYVSWDTVKVYLKGLLGIC